MRAPGLAKSTWNLFLASRGTIYLLDLRHPLHNLNLPTYYIHSRPARSYLVLPNPHRYTHLNHVKVLTAQALSPFEYILLARALLAERRMAQNESVNMAQSEGNNGTQNGNATWNATIDRSESVNGTQNGNVTKDRSESVNGTQNGNVSKDRSESGNETQNVNVTIARSESGNVALNYSNNTGQVVHN